MKKIIYLSILLLIFINLNAQIFSPKQIISSADNPQVVKSADFNNDGYIDIVYSSITDHKIAVSLFNSTTGTFDDEQIISTAFNFATSLYVADLDGDNYVDVLAISQLNHKVAWFKNDGAGNFILQPLINNDAQGASCVIAADIDGDNDLDVISASKNDDKIVWYENTDGNGIFSAPIIISENAELPTVIISADIDNDNDIDIIAGYALTDKIVLFENIDGIGTFSSEITITTETDNIISLFAADFNNDGNIDIVSASTSDNKVAWYRNINGSGTFTEQILISELTYVFDIFAADFDLDNDLDIACSVLGENKVIIIENTDGNGNFSNQHLISDLAYAVKGISAADYDNDGDIDIAAALSLSDEDKVVWFENGKATFVVHEINTIRNTTDICIFDINQDGNNDICYSEHYGIYWVENQGEGQSFGNEIMLDESSYNLNTINFVDLDNDNDADIIAADGQGDKIFWLENIDGNGNFSSPIIIDNVGNGPYNLSLSDYDNDNDQDFVIALVNENKIALYENDGTGIFSKTIINDTVNPTTAVFVDVNNDNFVDVLYATYENIAWLKNDGTGAFSTGEIITDTNDYCFNFIVSDFNNDNYDDVFYTPDYGLYFLQNQQNETFQNTEIYQYYSIMDIAAGDLDNDGDLEIIMINRNGDRVNFFENINGTDEFIKQLPISVNMPQVVAVGDINNDNWNDLAIGSWSDEGVYWLENYQYRILINPFAQYVCEGDKAYFSVISTGVINYQWQINTGSGFENISNNEIYSGANKAQLKIDEVTADMFGNEFRCLVYDKNNDELITESASLNLFVPSLVCPDNQERTADNSNTYTVVAQEFDLDTIYNKCEQNLIITNDYNNSETLAGEVFTHGTYTIEWEIQNQAEEPIDNCTFEIVINEFVGLVDLFETEISIYPNPTTGIFEIKNEELKIKNIKITDITGKIIYNLTRGHAPLYIENTLLQIDISTQPAGIYFIKIQTENEIITEKIIKQ